MIATISNATRDCGTYGYGTFEDNVRELARLNFQAEVAWQVEQGVLARHGLLRHSRVLDVACGAGAMTCQIATLLQRGSVLGVDLNESLLGEARERRTDSIADKIAFRKGDVYRLKDIGQFDFAYARFLFQHLERPIDALRSIGDALRPGGRVLVVDVDDRDLCCVPENDGFVRFLAEAARGQKRGGGNRMIGRALPELLQQAGFEEIRKETVRFDSDSMGLDPFLELTTTFKLEQFAPSVRADAERWLSAVVAQLHRQRARLQIDIHCVSGAVNA
ncbi:MAG TPA: class I SAM-dependent methyltransferase [Pirellulales bacterium]|nr:class I SAM-dependent methyltransferase [Pirellulales bacterium]